MDLALPAKPRRKPSLTPMIDVVFLLLVFFMLASRFGVDSILPLPLASQGGEYSGPPRLVSISPSEVQLNGQPVIDLVQMLGPLMQAPTYTVIIRARDGATLQRIVDVAETLKSAGYTSLVLVE